LRDDERQLGVSLHDEEARSEHHGGIARADDVLGGGNCRPYSFAAIEKWFPERRTCRVLPFIVAIAFFAISFLPTSHPYLGIVAFALAGLGCSALLPLTMSFAEEELTTITASVAGGLIAFYQIGYGIAAFGVGPLQNRAGWS
jgi:Cyanate permease